MGECSMRKSPKKAARKTTRKTTRKAAPRKSTAKRVTRMKTRPGAKAWTATEVSRLTKMYKTRTATEIAKTLRRSLSSVT